MFVNSENIRWSLCNALIVLGYMEDGSTPHQYSASEWATEKFRPKCGRARAAAPPTADASKASARALLLRAQRAPLGEVMGLLNQALAALE